MHNADCAKNAPNSGINTKRTKLFGHTFGGRKHHHGQKMKTDLLKSRAAREQKQIGQFLDDQAAAPHILEAAKKGPGVHNAPLPEGVPGRAFLPDGSEISVDSFRTVVKPDGSVRTAFPFNSQQ